MNTSKLDVIPIARWAAQRIHARHSWLELDDLEQEAVRAVLEAATRYDPARGAWSSYACLAALRHLDRYAYDVTAPVTSKHDRRKLRDVHRATPPRGTETRRAETTSEVPARDAAQDGEIRERLVELLGVERAALAYRVFAGEERPREVAKARGVPTAAVKRELRVIRSKVRRDPLLEEMRKP